jgi:pimeloyl-ACP methyl ester carboxylesterase
VIVDSTPHTNGFVDRHGVKIGYQLFGDGPAALLLLPTWTIVHTDFWKLQVRRFSQRYSLVTFDGRGNGASDRPLDIGSYSAETIVGDALAVLNSVQVDRVVVMSVSLGAYWAALLGALAPERVIAQVFIAPYLPLGPLPPDRVAAIESFDVPRRTYEGWAKWNRHYWHADWPGFLEFFFSRCFTEPDSRSFIDHFIAMGLQTTPEICALTEDADDLDETRALQLASAVAAPSLIIHGDEDAIAPARWGRRLALLTGGEFHGVRGGGHEPELREADEVNDSIDGFLKSRVWND